METQGKRMQIDKTQFCTICVTRDTYNSLIVCKNGFCIARILHYMDTMVGMEDSGLIGEAARTAVKFGYDLTKGTSL
jgi:hypothetical protein